MRGGRRGRGGRASFVRDSNHQETPSIYLPRPQYPKSTVPRRPPLSSSERACIEHFRRFRKQIRDGPLYTFLDVKLQLQKPGELGASQSSLLSKPAQSKSSNNPFDNMQTYSQKFSKPKRTMPKLDERRYVTSLFPTELQVLIDPSTSSRSVQRPKASTKPTSDRLDAEDQQLEKEAQEEEEFIDEEQDDDFEEDEGDDEDGRDDYNAEQYFDNGEDDALDDEGGGEFE